MLFKKAQESDFRIIRDFYWNLIDEMEAENEGYEGVPWSIECENKDVLIPHALAVSPKIQGQGIGAQLVNEIISAARSESKKAIRLDILGTNTAAERLYTKCGFRFVQAKPLFYEDTGRTEYKMYELNL